MTDLATTGTPGPLDRRTVPVAVLEKRLRTESLLMLLPPTATTITTVASTGLHAQMMSAFASGGADMLLIGVGGGVVVSLVTTGAALLTASVTGTHEALPRLKHLLVGSVGAGGALALLGGHPLIVGGYYLASLIGTWPWLRDRLRAVKDLRGRLAEETALEQSRAERPADTIWAEADVVDGEVVTTAIPADLAVYVQRWADGVAKGDLAGSVLLDGRRLPDGRIVFLVQGGAQGVQQHTVNARRGTIASALRLAVPDPTAGGGQTVVFDQEDVADQSQLRMQVINLASVAAAGGRVTQQVVRAPHNPYSVRIGGHIDDGTPALWDLADHDGAYSGVIVAGTNMGKSSVADQLGYRIRQLGWELAYCDPQRGASSPVLTRFADFPALGVENAEGMLRFLEDAADTREAWMAAHEGIGVIHPDLRAPCAPFGDHPDPLCPCGGVVPPPLFAVLDECDQTFNAPAAGTTTKLADRFGMLVKRIRKLCMGIIAITQIPELKTFGGSELLRSNLPVRNLLAMHVSSNVSGTLIPGLPYSPKLLPKISGRGLMCGQASRQMEVVLDWMPRQEKASMVAGPYAEELFAALPPRPLYVLDVKAAAAHLPSAGVDAAAHNRESARARLQAKFAGHAVARPSAPVTQTARPLMSWPSPVRTAAPSVMELEQMLDGRGGVVGDVLTALEAVADHEWLTVGELARLLGRVPADADTDLVRARARDLSVELAAVGAVLPVTRRGAGMSATAAEIRSALT